MDLGHYRFGLLALRAVVVTARVLSFDPEVITRSNYYEYNHNEDGCRNSF